ncbi:MAG: T9SS type A sorting domain-containing protein [Fimbriimonadaceae bacterium]|nr:T9SS type A sorting domain-containing protein [Chitinophagales bacterium]
MRKLNFIVFAAIMCFAFTTQAQLGVSSEKTFGGTGNDFGFDMEPTISGGYILAGYTQSTDDDVTETIGALDFWIAEIDADENILWEESYGGSENDYCRAIEPTGDGGWIVVGSTLSSDGDITDNSGNKDGWVIKINSTGGLEWQNTFGGEAEDQLNNVVATSDGGYLLVGGSKSTTGDVETNNGLDDFWILKIDADGDLLWIQNYGGDYNEAAFSVIEIADGFMVTGDTDSNEGDVSGNHHSGGMNFSDYWVLRLDTDGELVWQKCFGGFTNDEATTIIENGSGNYVVAGSAKSNDGDVSGHFGETNRYDYWVIEIDGDGTLLNDQNYGGTKDDQCYTIAADLDGGYVLAGESASSDEDVVGHHGASTSDFWVVKTDASLNLLVQASLGGSSDDVAQKIIPLGVDDYVGFGFTKSEGDDVSFHHGGAGNQDYWFVEIGPCSLAVTTEPIDVNTCEGSDISLTIEITGSASTYTWIFIGGPDITTATNTLTLDDVTTAYSHDYYVIINGSCGSDTSEVATLFVEAFTTPDITPLGPVSLCTTGSVLLSTTTTGVGYTYQWYKDAGLIPGETGMTYTATIAGSYYVSVSNGEGCEKNSATVLVTNEGAAATITTSGTTNLCATGSVMFTTITGAGYTYQWYKDGILIPGATSISYTATAVGSYYVIVTAGVCVSTSTTIVVTNSGPAATIIAGGNLDICETGSVSLSSTTVGTGLSFQWLLNGVPIGGAVGLSIIAIETGDYTLVATNLTGCADTSAALVVFNSCVAIDEIHAFADFSISPNPNNGYFTISLTNIETKEDITIQITDITGKVIYSTIEKTSANITLHFNNKDLPAGNYFVRAVSENAVMVKKVIVGN